GVLVPVNYTFTATDKGVHTFTSLTKLVTAGSQTLSANDTVNSSILATSNAIIVSAAAATHFGVSAPASATAGTAFVVTVTALDAFNNVAVNYSRTVKFSTSDPNTGAVVVPANYSFVAADNGIHVFTNGFLLATAGSRSITATDTLSSTIVGSTSTNVVA